MEKTVEYAERPLGSIICPVCGAKQSSDRDRCFSCGTKFKFKNEQDRNIAKKKIYVCSVCGKKYDKEVNFCAKCGNKVEEKYV